MAECQHSWEPVYDTDRSGFRTLIGYRCGKCGAFRGA